MTSTPAHPAAAQLPGSAAVAARTDLSRWLAPAIFLFVAFVALFFRWFLKQNEHSWHKLDDWGHAYVVPLFSAYVLWRAKDRLAASRIQPFWPGFLPLLLGVVCYFYFVVGVANHMLQGASIILALAGLVLMVLGTEVFAIAFLPIAYLLFGITLAEQLMNKVTFPLQLIGTQGAWLILKVISLPGDWFSVEASGNVLELAYQGKKIPLNVAEQCSGMRMVVAFVALAGAVAILTGKHWWQRVALLMLAVPVAVLMNIIRVAVLAIASLKDANLAEGNVHMLIGTLLLIPGLFLFLGVDWALQRLIVDAAPASKGATP